MRSHRGYLVFLAGGFGAATLLLLAPRAPLEVARASAANSYSARGVVQAVAPDRRAISIAHEAIPGFMPAMIMSFDARSAEQLADLRAGDHVTFSFTVTDDARVLLDSIRRVNATR
jgi:Cu/Ag efflux protein CusF